MITIRHRPIVKVSTCFLLAPVGRRQVNLGQVRSTYVSVDSVDAKDPAMDPWLIYVLSGRFLGEVYICTVALPAS